MGDIFEMVISDAFMNDILIALGFSTVLFVVMQKIKDLPIIKSDTAILITDFILALGLGIPYTMYYYQLPIFEAVVVGLLAFVGAPAIYTALKKQTIINYKPKSKSDVIEVPKDNYIDRG